MGNGDVPSGEGDCPDVCTAMAPEGGPDAAPWLLHTSGGKLWSVDLTTGAGTELCQLDPPEGYLPSLTFSRANRLFASDGDNLLEVDPCSCRVEPLGEFPPLHGIVFGISPDEGEGLFAISGSSHTLLRIDPDYEANGVPMVTEVGPLGFPFGTHGATWSDEGGVVWAINGANSTLYRVDPATGAATPAVVLSASFESVGMELHPESGEMYACNEGGKLLHIDTASGAVTAIGDSIAGAAGCTNLGAPWSASGDVCLPPPAG